jgi:hypothetical protein
MSEIKDMHMCFRVRLCTGMLVLLALAVAWVPREVVPHTGADAVTLGYDGVSLLVGVDANQDFGLYTLTAGAYEADTVVANVAVQTSALARNGSSVVLSLTGAGVVAFESLPLLGESRLLHRTPATSLAISQTGALVAAAHNESVEVGTTVLEPPVGATAYGAQMKLYGEVLLASYILSAVTYVHRCVHTTAWSCANAYNTSGAVSFDIALLNGALVYAFGAPAVTSGGVAGAGTVTVEGAVSQVISGSDAFLSFGRCVSFDSTGQHLAVGGGRTAVYALDGTYTRAGSVLPASVGVSLNGDGSVLAVANSENVTIYVRESSTPTSAPTRAPDNATHRADVATVVLSVLCAVVAISLFVVIACYSYEPQQQLASYATNQLMSQDAYDGPNQRYDRDAWGDEEVVYDYRQMGSTAR